MKTMFLAAPMLAAIFATQPAQAELLEKTKQVGNTTVHYKVVLPERYDSSKAYPGILAFGGGPQAMRMVDSVLDRNLRAGGGAVFTRQQG